MEERDKYVNNLLFRLGLVTLECAFFNLQIHWNLYYSLTKYWRSIALHCGLIHCVWWWCFRLTSVCAMIDGAISLRMRTCDICRVFLYSFNKVLSKGELPGS